MGAINHWTTGEYKILSSLYPTATKEVVQAALPRHPWSSISTTAIRELKLTREREVNWSETELAYLADNYAKLGAAAVADYLKRPVHGVRNKASKMKIGKYSRYVRWTAAHKQLVAQHYETRMSLVELAALIDRPVSDVIKYAREQGLSRRGKGLTRKAKPVKVRADRKRAPRVAKAPKAEKPVLASPALEVAPVAALKAPPAKRGKHAEDTGPGSAAYIRNLPYDHPERQAYNRGGRRTWEEFMNPKKEEQVLPMLDLFQLVGGSQRGMEGGPNQPSVMFNHVPDAAQQREEVARG